MNMIAVKADLGRLVDVLGASFTDSMTAVFELIQNAERSGARQVWLYYSPKGRTLTVEDDGAGIADPSKLLALAESGWSPEIMAERTPYGMGFISALFAAEEIEVDSQQFTFRAKTADIRALKPVAVNQLPVARTGTRVTLFGVGMEKSFDELLTCLKRRLSGFPIPVSVNGLEVPRPHAVSGDGWHSTPVGLIRLSLDTFGQAVILQGMRFGCTEFERRGSVVHLDPTRYFGRLPDRTKVIDSCKMLREVADAMKLLAGQVLAARKTELSGEEFVLRHAEHCRKWQCLELLEDRNHFRRTVAELAGATPEELLLAAIRAADLEDEIVSLLEKGPLVLHQKDGQIHITSTR